MRNQSAPLPGRGIGNPENPVRNSSAAQWPLRRNKCRAWRRRQTQLPVAVLGLWLALLLIPVKARGVEITPFYTQNQSPVAQIFGLPAAGDAKVLPKGKFSALLAADVASNFAEDATFRENILLDGENYRFTLALRYGITDRFEGNSARTPCN